MPGRQALIGEGSAQDEPGAPREACLVTDACGCRGMRWPIVFIAYSCGRSGTWPTGAGPAEVQLADHLQVVGFMITTNPAEALGLEGYGLEPGCRADLCVFAAPTGMDAIRLVAPRQLVLRAGKVVARTEPAATTVVWDGREEAVDFLKPTT